jgi:hypothetical protein
VDFLSTVPEMVPVIPAAAHRLFMALSMVEFVRGCVCSVRDGQVRKTGARSSKSSSTIPLILSLAFR